MGQDKERAGKVILGRIAGAHGVKGWVKVFSHTEPAEAIADYRPWLLGEDGRLVEPLEAVMQGKKVVARLEGVSDRSQAEALVGLEIYVERHQLPEPGERQFYWSDLIGLEVKHQDGESLGTLAEMMATGANDVMVVEGDRQRLIPFVQGETVIEVDLDAGRLTVDWDKEF